MPSSDTTMKRCPIIDVLYTGPYSSAHSLNLSHDDVRRRSCTRPMMGNCRGPGKRATPCFVIHWFGFDRGETLEER